MVDGKGSFVLHAPLELMARAALLPYVAPAARDAARGRIGALGAAYEASGPPVAEPRPQRYASPPDALRRLAAAVEREELDDVDAAADWLGARCRPDELVAALADVVVDRLSAAGHGNIYLALLGRTQPRGLPGQMLRHPARELATASQHRIAVPRAISVPDQSGLRTRELLDTLTRVAVVDPPPSLFIAPMVEHAQAHGAFDGLLDDDGGFRAPAAPPFALLRFAAQAMLQGPAEQAPFGWTHCLTLAQAPLLVASAGAGADRARAVFVAAAYLAAHWATQGRGHVDLDAVPHRTVPTSPRPSTTRPGQPRPPPGTPPIRRPRSPRSPRRPRPRTTPTGSSTRSRASTRRQPTRRTARPTSPRLRTSTPGGTASCADDPTTTRPRSADQRRRRGRGEAAERTRCSGRPAGIAAGERDQPVDG